MQQQQLQRKLQRLRSLPQSLLFLMVQLQQGRLLRQQCRGNRTHCCCYCSQLLLLLLLLLLLQVPP
jgi:hypothetical protein